MIAMRSLFMILSVAAAVLCTGCTGKNVIPPEGVEIDRVLSAVNVGFKMLEQDDVLYLSYYDSLHRLTVATFDTRTGARDYAVLPTEITWDSHNYMDMAFDADGFLHLSGNMHAQPLKYFRSTRPYDIHTLEQVPEMTGEDETRVTYPVFMKGPDGRLIFHYRIGGSGNGSEIYNVYDTGTKTWKRLLDKPLMDGEGLMNAYMQGPVLSKDGRYHLIWVWRDTPDCSTNHTLSYARSRDLVHWETVRGEETPLPITIGKTGFHVDPTPAKGGLFNPGIKLGFDEDGTPVIGYHKYDSAGNNQLDAARFTDGEWMIRQLTHWDYRWQFEGNGTMKNEISISNPVYIGDGKMAFGYRHVKEGAGEVVFDARTLEATGTRPVPPGLPEEYTAVKGAFPGLIPHVLVCGRYLLHWETLPTNRDRKPAGELPPPSPLMLYKLDSK